MDQGLCENEQRCQAESWRSTGGLEGSLPTAWTDRGRTESRPRHLPGGFKEYTFLT